MKINILLVASLVLGVIGAVTLAIGIISDNFAAVGTALATLGMMAGTLLGAFGIKKTVDDIDDAEEFIANYDNLKADIKKDNDELDEKYRKVSRKTREDEAAVKELKKTKNAYIQKAKDELRDEYYPVLEDKYHKEAEVALAKAKAEKAKAERDALEYAASSVVKVITGNRNEEKPKDNKVYELSYDMRCYLLTMDDDNVIEYFRTKNRLYKLDYNLKNVIDSICKEEYVTEILTNYVSE